MDEEFTIDDLHDDDEPLGGPGESLDNIPGGDDYIPGLDDEEDHRELPSVEDNVNKPSTVDGISIDEQVRMGLLTEEEAAHLKDKQAPDPEKDALPGEIDTPETKDTQDNEDVEIPAIDQYLAQFNIEGGMIDFGDGESKHFSELSQTDQLAVLNQIHEQHSTLEEQNSMLDEKEIQLINHLRNSGDSFEDAINDLVDAKIAQRDAITHGLNRDLDSAHIDSLYAEYYRQKDPEISDVDLEAKIIQAKESPMYQDFGEQLRANLKAVQERDIREAQLREQAEREAEIAEDRRTIASAAANTKQVGSIALTDNIRNEVLNDILEVNDQGDSVFMEKVFSDPQELIRVATLAKYAEQWMAAREQYWQTEKNKAYSRGRQSVLGKAPTEPIKVSAYQQRKNTQPQSRTVQHTPQVDDNGEDYFTLEDLHDD